MGLLRRYRAWVGVVALVLVVAGGIGWLVAADQPAVVDHEVRTVMPADLSDSPASIGLVVEEFRAAVTDPSLIAAAADDDPAATADQVRSTISVQRIGSSRIVAISATTNAEVDGPEVLRALVAQGIEQILGPQGAALARQSEVATAIVASVEEERRDFLVDSTLRTTDDYRERVSLGTNAELRAKEAEIEGRQALAEAWAEFAEEVRADLPELAAESRRLDDLQRSYDSANADARDAVSALESHTLTVETLLADAAALEVMSRPVSPTSRSVQAALAAMAVALVLLVLIVAVATVTRRERDDD